MGLAKNIILKNINYFFSKSLPSDDGVFGCGYLYPSVRFAESYASDGATCCFTEGFMCLLAGEDHPLWLSETKPLPIENEDYLVECPVNKLDFLIQGEKDYSGITLFNNSIHYHQSIAPTFNDMCGYYSKFCYNSRSGFSLSTRDKASFDNMISLHTADGVMASLRGRIETISTAKDLLVSYHIPFPNDLKTRITSWVIPLSKGYHVRIHKVELSRPYCICEGGFCIGMTSDSYHYENGVLTYKNAVSKIEVSGSCPTEYNLQKPHPGMHNLRPLALYPSWSTKEMPAGTYRFATTVFFSDNKQPSEKPEVCWNGNSVTIRFGDFKKTIDV